MSKHPVVRFIAHLFSTIFHPLLLPTYSVILFALGDMYIFPAGDRFGFGDVFLTTAEFRTLQVFFLTAFYPAFFIFLMIRLGFASGVNLPNRDERVIPYVATGAFFIWSFVALRNQIEHPAISGVILGAAIAIFVALIVNQLFFKISAHTTGMGGMIATLIYFVPIMFFNIGPLLLVGALVAGAVGSSRLILKAHETREIYAGYLNGFFCQSLAFQILPLF